MHSWDCNNNCLYYLIGLFASWFDTTTTTTKKWNQAMATVVVARNFLNIFPI